MIAALALLITLQAAAGPAVRVQAVAPKALAACPAASQGPELPGRPQPETVVDREAADWNRLGSESYQGKDFRGAEAHYRRALEKDARYQAARLNLACALARQERYPAAAREAAAIVSQEFMPWSREVRDATDLAILHARPELRILVEAAAPAATKWGRHAQAGLIVVARTGPSLRPRGPGVFALGPRQELFSWRPDTGLFLQLTAEDGRVLGHARSPNGRLVLYLRAGKLVRSPSAPTRLREMSVRLLDLTSMHAGPAIDVPGDLLAVQLGFLPTGEPWLVLEAGPSLKQHFKIQDGKLVRTTVSTGKFPGSRGTRIGTDAVTAGGVSSNATDGMPCRLRAHDRTTPEGPRVQVRPAGGRPFYLPGKYGMGLFTLQLPL